MFHLFIDFGDTNFIKTYAKIIMGGGGLFEKKSPPMHGEYATEVKSRMGVGSPIVSIVKLSVTAEGTTSYAVIT